MKPKHKRLCYVSVHLIIEARKLPAYRSVAYFRTTVLLFLKTIWYCSNLTNPFLTCFVIVGIIASKRCTNIEIYDNLVHDGGAMAAGIFLHRSSDRAKVYGEIEEATILLCGSSYSKVPAHTVRK